MKENLLQDNYTRALVGKAMQDGNYVLACGVKSLQLEPKVDLETPFVIACTEQQAQALFQGQPFAGRMYSVTGTHEIAGTMDSFAVSLGTAKPNERYTAEWVAPQRYEGEWTKGTVVLELLIQGAN